MSVSSDYRSVDLRKTVKILSNPKDKATLVDPITVPALLKRTAELYGDTKALMYKDAETKKWVGITYKEYRDRATSIAKVFIKVGLERYGTVAVLAANCVEWMIAELATIHAGATICGIYPSNSPDSCLHILETAKTSIVVVDDDKQLEKIKSIRHKLPHLKAIIQINAGDSESFEGFYKWSELDAIVTDDVESEYIMRHSQIVPNECCCLVFTSGTVGMPKGVMLSHDNLTHNSQSVISRFGSRKGEETFVSYLPLSHIAGQMTDIFVPLTVAGTVYFADSDAMKGSLMKTMQEARPTFFMAVPRIYEKIQEKMIATQMKSNFISRMIGAWAQHVTLQHNLTRMSGFNAGSIQYKLSQKLNRNDIMKDFGLDKCRAFITGAAPMTLETKKFFLGLDVKILDAYGMSETTGIHCACPDNYDSFATVGLPLKGLTTKISEPDATGRGEICLKGRHVFMGYLNEIKKTEETFDADGWLRTGDVGYIDRDGSLFITGRIKELIITAGGENIPPVLIENNVRSECSAISNAVLIGDYRKFLTMLVTLKTKMNRLGEPLDEFTIETLSWLEGLGLKYTKLSEVLAAGPDPKVMQSIQEAIARANKKAISNAQKVQKFAILPHDLSIPTGELGPTMKLKRNVVAEMYSEIIEKLYN